MSLRYHLISLGAAFLALATGVVLGAGPLSAKVTDVLNPAVTQSAPDAAKLKKQLAARDAYVAATANRVVRRTLVGSRVVLVVAQGTPVNVVNAVAAELASAGAKVSAQVTLTAAWTDPTQTTVLTGITTQLAPPEVVAGGTSAYGQASAALGAALLTKQTGPAGAPSEPAAALLAGLSAGGFLTTSGTPEVRATLAVLLTPGTGTAAGSSALLPLGPALDAAGVGALVAGPVGSSEGAGTVGAIRRDATVKTAVSTVDNADELPGRIAIALALAQQIGGKQGHYGQGFGAAGPVPAGG